LGKAGILLDGHGDHHDFDNDNTIKRFAKSAEIDIIPSASMMPLRGFRGHTLLYFK